MLHLVALMLLAQQTLQPISQGEASYYTVASCGRITASGEKLVDSAMTCAMRTQPFGDRVLVVAENGASVVCRVNDRGPWVKGRVIDLTKAAMRKLHPTEGTLKVRVYKLPDKLAALVAK